VPHFRQWQRRAIHRREADQYRADRSRFQIPAAIYDEAGIDDQKLSFIMDLKMCTAAESPNTPTSLRAQFYALRSNLDHNPLESQGACAFQSATQNEINVKTLRTFCAMAFMSSPKA
jgi:hypothetical protein